MKAAVTHETLEHSKELFRPLEPPLLGAKTDNPAFYTKPLAPPRSDFVSVPKCHPMGGEQPTYTRESVTEEGKL